MSQFRHNILANFGGQAATTVIAFITVPFYMRYLGAAGFGLAGFLLSAQALISVLDFGLSTTANREISRQRAQERDPSETRDLVRTLEIFYLGMALLIFVGCLAAAPWVAKNWFKEGTFDAPTLRLCLVLGGASIALRWPISLYQGLLRGLEHQVKLNVINGVTVLLRGVGMIAVLAYLTHAVSDFFWWQLLFSLLELGIFAFQAWKHFNDARGRQSPRFKLSLLSQLWSYSAQVGGLSLFAVCLKQLDKILISRLLPIEQLGFYNTASLASNGLTKLVQPVQVAAFPRLAGLHVRQAQSDLAAVFHRSCQTTAFLVCPCACILLFFPTDILAVWTNDPALAATAAPVLTVLSAAMLLNCQMNVPFALQLASGMTWLPLWANAIGAIILGPALYWLVQTYGLVGAAYAWLVFNVLNIIFVPPLMFRRLIPGHYWRWVLQDVLPFVAIALACFGAVRGCTGNLSLFPKALLVFATAGVYSALAWLASPGLKNAIPFPIFLAKRSGIGKR